MPPRPSALAKSKHTANRLSAVYIGANPTTTNNNQQASSSSSSPSHHLSLTSPPNFNQTHIPDLPEPPSPGASSAGGLPSPPATNSTGSGSTNDDPHINEKSLSLVNSTNAAGSYKDPPSNSMLKGSTTLTINNNNTNNSNNTRSLHRSNSSISSTISSFSRSGDRQSIFAESLPDDELAHNGDDKQMENDDGDGDGDGDDTARFDLRRSFTGGINTSSTENVLALQRAKSLTQRNRMVLDKLSSYPRASTPSSASASGSSTTKSTASRLSSTRRPTSTHSHSHSHSSSSPAYDPRSGSETERESRVSSHSHHSNPTSHISNSNGDRDRDTISAATSSHHRTLSHASTTSTATDVRPTTPPLNTASTASSSSSTSYRRKRVPSAPTSPLRIRNDLSNSSGGGSGGGGSLGSPTRRRKRMSMVSLRGDGDEGGDRDERHVAFDKGVGAGTTRMRDRDRDREQDWARDRESRGIMGSTRRRRESPRPFYEYETSAAGGSGNNGRRRAALPVEFRNAGERHRDGRLSTELEPITPLRAPSIAFTNSNSSSASASASVSASTNSSNNRQRHSVRHSYSTDLSAITPSIPSRRGAITPIMGMSEYRERKQSLRGGSAESALAYGRGGPGRLVGEGLRAAGLSPTRTRTMQRFSGEGAEREREVFGAGRRRMIEWESREGHDSGDDDDDDHGYEAKRGERRRADTIVAGRGNGNGSSVGPGRPNVKSSMALYHYQDRDQARDRGGDYEEGEERYGYDEDAGTRPLRGSRSVAGFPLRDQHHHQQQQQHNHDIPDRAPSALSRYGTLTRAHVLQDAHTPPPPPPERYASPYGSSRRHSATPAAASSSSTSLTLTSQHQQQSQEHTRLMLESLIMFEGHAARSGAGMTGDLIRGAQGLVGAAERLNEMLRYGTARALEEQVYAEVEEDGEGGGDGRGNERDVWGRVGGEYREGLRVSDELVRGLTGFLLGIGKTLKELTAAGGESSVHARSVSLDEEGLGRSGGGRKRGSMSPDVVAGLGERRHGSSNGGGSASGRRSVESRRSWEPTREGGSGGGPGSDVSKRLAARVESVLSGGSGGARPPSAVSMFRDRERHETPPLSTPSAAQSSSASRGTHLNMSGSGSMSRRLFTPREQREMQQSQNQQSRTTTAGGMPTIHSQESLYGEYEPSPTPAARVNQTSLDRSRTLPPLAIPKPLPTLPSESLRRSQTVSDKPPSNTVRDKDRRKPSMASISTVRGNATSHFPASLTTPSNATTALTPHTVSTTHTPERTAFPSFPRTDSDRSVRSSVTFSRPSTVSISTLNGMMQNQNQSQNQNQRNRTGSGASAGAEPSTSVPPNKTPIMLSPEGAIQSGSETERPLPRKLQHQTLGRLGRMSLDGAMALNGAAGGGGNVKVHPADRSAAVTATTAGHGVSGSGRGGILPPMNTAARRERRKTVTDIWPRD